MSTPYPPPDPDRPDDAAGDQPPNNPWDNQPGAGQTPPPPPPGYGTQPPPPSYGTPPAGGQGGYGAFPPPPPPPSGAYGAAPVAPPNDLGTALSIAWSRLWKNFGVLLGAFLIWGIGLSIVIGALYAIVLAPSIATSTSDSEAMAALGSGISVGGTIVVGVVSALAGFFAQIGIINGALSIVDNGRARLGDFFTFRNIGSAIVVALLLGIASGLVGWTWIGAYVVFFFGMFALYFAIDRNMGFMDAIKASVDVAMKNAVPVILLLLVTQLAAPLVGLLACFIGLLVTMPWAMLSIAVFYRRVTGGTVAA
ncbi:hypothetical protein [Serinibacter salmoneus]|uniref:Putative membrane protein n=1 Tax=Serinibacter salmoneus TaxID=556530 RepID=A0A2A9D0W8_9MICO|nr:hypothetical protein [Serinibacter salmoneus]PFG20026.1 putative membrane protein [Serinibacter salmoneus]